MDDRRDQFQARIHREIPISRHMQVSIVTLGEETVTVACPLSPNINHKQTAFGGSIHSLALMSCWSLATLAVQALEKEDLRTDYIVVQDSSIDYRKPISGDFTASAKWASPKVQNRFLTSLRKHGRARAEFVSEVRCGPQICAVAKARFVAQILKPKV